jgi:hypothetical protein
VAAEGTPRARETCLVASSCATYRRPGTATWKVGVGCGRGPSIDQLITPEYAPLLMAWAVRMARRSRFWCSRVATSSLILQAGVTATRCPKQKSRDACEGGSLPSLIRADTAHDRCTFSVLPSSEVCMLWTIGVGWSRVKFLKAMKPSRTVHEPKELAAIASCESPQLIITLVTYLYRSSIIDCYSYKRFLEKRFSCRKSPSWRRFMVGSLDDRAV